VTRRATTTAVPRTVLLQDALVVTQMEAVEALPPPPVRLTAPHCAFDLADRVLQERAWHDRGQHSVEFSRHTAREPFVTLARESKTEYDAQKKLLSDFEATADSRQPARGRKRSKPGCVSNAPARLSWLPSCLLRCAI
jgi:hypothetical protein